MGACCARNAQGTVEVPGKPPPGARTKSAKPTAAHSSSSASTAVDPGGDDEDGRLPESLEELPPFFAEVLRELERYRGQLGGLKHFNDRPCIERKVTKKELSASHSDYEYIYLTILGLACLHLRNEEIVRKNNGQAFNRNPGVRMLERVTGFTMHAERGGADHLLKTAPASVIEAFQLSKDDPGGPLKFFKSAFDRTGDPCLEGRVGRIIEYIEARRRLADPAGCAAPPWEDVTLRALPDGAPVQDVVGEHLRVFAAECTWRWAGQQGLSYEAACEARQHAKHQEDFANLFNAGAFEAAMLARGVAGDPPLRQWESSTKSGEWIPYEPDVSLQIEQAHNRGDSNIKIRIGPKSWLYIVDFAKMVQRNSKTGQERALRVVAISEGMAKRGPLSREALASAIRFFVDLETLPPTPGSSPVSTQPGASSREAADTPSATESACPASPPREALEPGEEAASGGVPAAAHAGGESS